MTASPAATTMTGPRTELRNPVQPPGAADWPTARPCRLTGKWLIAAGWRTTLPRTAEQQVVERRVAERRRVAVSRAGMTGAGAIRTVVNQRRAPPCQGAANGLTNSPAAIVSGPPAREQRLITVSPPRMRRHTVTSPRCAVIQTTAMTRSGPGGSPMSRGVAAGLGACSSAAETLTGTARMWPLLPGQRLSWTVVPLAQTAGRLPRIAARLARTLGLAA